MVSFKNLNITLLLLVSSTLLISCGGKLPGADARKYDPDPKKRVAKNLEEGRGFRLSTAMNKKGGAFDFASSNPMLRASLNVLDFIPLENIPGKTVLEHMTPALVINLSALDYIINEKSSNDGGSTSEQLWCVCSV